MTDRVPHTVHRFDDELDALRALIRRRGEIAEGQVADATRSLLERDTAIASQVLAREPEMNALERDVEAQVIRLPALRQPVAVDLRLVIDGLKASHDRSGLATMPQTQRSAPSCSLACLASAA